MNQNCNHAWRESQVYSEYAHKVFCQICGISKIAKPRKYLNPLEVPFAANEFIIFKLICLLRKKGLEIEYPSVELYNINKYRFYQQRDIWGYGVALIEDLGEHSRLSNQNIKDDGYIKYPNWLYYFDRWVGRIDGNGDNNLLLINNKAVPVDFNLAFAWNNPVYLLKLNNLNVPYHKIIKKYKDSNVLKVIKSLTDKEIFQACENIDTDFIPTQGIIAYYSGLCLRRDLLY